MREQYNRVSPTIEDSILCPLCFDVLSYKPVLKRQIVASVLPLWVSYLEPLNELNTFFQSQLFIKSTCT